MTITKDTIIGDILTIAPQTAPLFMNIGMHCLGCPASRGETVEQACMVHGPLLRRICPSFGGGARGGGSTPRVGSNALNALYSKAFSERSEDFSAAGRRESNDIFQAGGKVPGLF